MALPFWPPGQQAGGFRMDARQIREKEARLALDDPEYYARILEIRNPGLPLIVEVPRPGDVVRTNDSPAEFIIDQVTTRDPGRLHFACRFLDQDGRPTTARAYKGPYILEAGRLLGVCVYSPEVTGWNIYNLGRAELFVLRRPYRAMPIGRKECAQAQRRLFSDSEV